MKLTTMIPPALCSLLSVAMTLLAGNASASLVAHYTFNDPANPGAAAVGTAANLGKNASITTIDPAVGIGALRLTNNSGSDTSGSDGAVSGNTFSWSNDVRTVAFWMRAQGTQDTNATMISLGAGTSNGNRFDVRLNGTNLRLEVQGGGVNTSVAVGNGNWYHVTIVVPGDGATVANAQYFVHNTSAGLVGSGTFSGSSTAINTGTGPLRMGDSYQDTSRDFFGVLDDVRLYTSALTQTEAQALAALWAPGPVPGSPLTWAGTAGGGTWDLDATNHWKDALSNPVTFKNYDLVTFDDSATTGSVNLAGPDLQPYSITFANATLPYTLQGGVVSGFGSLVKSGAADVTMLIDNNRPGTTTISAGTLRFGNGGSTGSPGIGPIINNGALVIARDGTVALSGGISGTGTLEIQGPGTTLLGGTNSYTGATTVSGGTLRVNGTLASPVTVNPAAVIAAGPATGTGTATMGSLTLAPASASSFRVGFSAGDKITVSAADGLNIGGAHTVSLTPTSEWLPNDSFVLFDYTTSYLGNIANLQLGAMPHGSFSIQDDTANTEIRVTVDSLETLVWKGNTAQPTLWDVNQTANWALLSNASAVPYFQYDKVLFNATAANTSVVIQEPVSPMRMEFNFDAPVTYQFSGAAGITGAVTLDKTGSGTLVFGTPNSFNGTTTINGGILRLIDGATWG
ncbi:MAG: autotransporter-associated beta strand repeat-containing protein, partial [Akkermansiaceae bacterium]|nr:autotransporter-associated beta strand repeat-containing protein [Akkermansiaceae bacterium]